MSVYTWSLKILVLIAACFVVSGIRYLLFDNNFFAMVIGLVAGYHISKLDNDDTDLKREEAMEEDGRERQQR